MTSELQTVDVAYVAYPSGADRDIVGEGTVITLAGDVLELPRVRTYDAARVAQHDVEAELMDDVILRAELAEALGVHEITGFTPSKSLLVTGKGCIYVQYRAVAPRVATQDEIATKVMRASAGLEGLLSIQGVDKIAAPNIATDKIEHLRRSIEHLERSVVEADNTYNTLEIECARKLAVAAEARKQVRDQLTDAKRGMTKLASLSSLRDLDRVLGLTK